MGRISAPRYLIVIVTLVATFWLIEQVFDLMYRIADILLIFGLAWLLKLLLEPLIRRLQQWHMPRGAAIGIAYLLVVGGVVGSFVWLVPQLTALARNVPQLAAEATLRAEGFALWLQGRGVQIDPNALTSQIARVGGEIAQLAAQRAFNFAQSFVGVLGRFALVLTVSIYWSLTTSRMTDVLRLVIPPRWRDEYDEFVRDVNATYSSYIRGYFYIVALGTIMSGALLYSFRVPNATLWLLAVALLRLFPFVGGTAANVLLITVLFLSLPLTSAIVALVLIAVGQMLLTNVLMPRVMSRELGINPLLVLFAVLLGGRIYGVAGILFSIPAAAIIAAIIGKAVNRYLIPLYETGGWWTEQVTVVQGGDRRAGGDRRGTGEPRSVERREQLQPTIEPIQVTSSTSVERPG